MSVRAHASNVGGRGYLEAVIGTDPAANVQIAEAVPANERWRVLAIHLQLVTDSTVADRTVTVIFKTADGDEITRDVSGTTQQASETMDYHLAIWETKPSDVDGADAYMTIPNDFWLGEGWTIETSVANWQTGDNWAAPTIIVESYDDR